jgi:hypothetical protein
MVADLAEVLDAAVAVVQADVLALACRLGAEGLLAGVEGEAEAVP